MCVGAIMRLTEIRDDAGVPVGRLEDGSTVTLSFVPEASVGTYLLIHLGIPVEIVDPQEAHEVLALRQSGDTQGGSRA